MKVKSIGKILSTLDLNGRNRGLAFKPEMFRFCKQRYRVLGKVQHRINEFSGEISQMKDSCIVLESVYCHGMRIFCSRANYHYWREIWLRRC